ncbi:hypothetical protein ANCCAN_03444 [Ancylostoma caninum]|uniref:Uncharacterized protein n=1 Tax=Ancylostoma caninum TaxID=29170 RepID=A0A368H1D4_ANCCA|nr:hypothetical protein ANCCAN_03444 [Ancylostoma caninum]
MTSSKLVADSPAAPGLVRQLGLSGIANGATTTSFCTNTSSVSGGGGSGLTVVLPPSSRFSTSTLLHSLQSPASSTFTSSGQRQTAANRYATSSHLPHFDRLQTTKVRSHVFEELRTFRKSERCLELSLDLPFELFSFLPDFGSLRIGLGFFNFLNLHIHLFHSTHSTASFVHFHEAKGAQRFTD